MLTNVPDYLNNAAMLHRLQVARELAAQRSGRPAATPITYEAFKQRFWRNYVHTRYQAAIDDKLMQVTEYLTSGGQRGINRLMIFIPPRHGKTENVSRKFPAWLLGIQPDTRLIAASYGATLAYRNSRMVRNLIADDRYREWFPHVRLADDSAAVDSWDIKAHDGGLIAAGVGGGITGHGAKLIIIDDVVKSRAEAESATYRQRVVDWYNNDLLTRLEEPGGAIILMMTRWQQNDLAGYLLDDDAESWDVLRLPALAEDDDPLGRQPGEALWPERYSEAILQARRERMGDYAFSALYQQRPRPPGGGLFDVEQVVVVDQSPPVVKAVRFYDLAVTAKRQSDYTAGVKLGITEHEQVVIMDLYHVQKQMPDVHEDIFRNAVKDGRDVRFRLEGEKAGIIQLDYLFRDPRLRPYAFDKKAPIGDKFTRAQPFAARVNAGKVLMVRAGWNRKLLDELSVFPNGDNDDITDALSGAYDMLATAPEEWEPFLV